MTGSESQQPKRMHPSDRAGLLGSLVFPLVLGLLWLGGHGPWDQQGCRSVTVSKALHLDLEREGGQLTLSGAVSSDADKQAILEAAAGVFTRDKINDGLTVDLQVPPLAWRDNAKGLLAHLKSLDTPARFKIDGDELTMTGTASDEDTKSRLARDAGAVLGTSVALRDHMTVRPLPVEEKPQPALAPQLAPVVAVAPPPTEAAPVLVNGLMKRTLPNGTVIDIAPGGLETKVIGFIEDKSRAVDKSIWFDFDRLYFQTGSSNLTPESKAQVQTMTEILRAYPATAIKVGGYTDNVGDPGFNLKLSSARADRVMKELVAQGVTADRLESEGYGEQHPAADNVTDQGRAKNRRTAVSVRKK